MRNRFNVGDRVRYLADTSSLPQGTLGTVISLHYRGSPEVSWDNGYWAKGMHHVSSFVEVIKDQSENIPEEW